MITGQVLHLELTTAWNVDAAIVAAVRRTIVAAQPGSAEGHFNLGLVLVAMGRDGEAARAFREVLRLRPGDADALRVLDKLGR